MVIGAVMASLAAWENSGKSDGIPALYLSALRPWTIAPRSTGVSGVSTARSFHT